MSFVDTSAPYFFVYGGMGISIALANAGSAYGSFRAAIGIAKVGTFDERNWSGLLYQLLWPVFLVFMVSSLLFKFKQPQEERT